MGAIPESNLRVMFVLEIPGRNYKIHEHDPFHMCGWEGQTGASLN